MAAIVDTCEEESSSKTSRQCCTIQERGLGGQYRDGNFGTRRNNNPATICHPTEPSLLPHTTFISLPPESSFLAYAASRHHLQTYQFPWHWTPSNSNSPSNIQTYQFPGQWTPNYPNSPFQPAPHPGSHNDLPQSLFPQRSFPTDWITPRSR